MEILGPERRGHADGPRRGMRAKGMVVIQEDQWQNTEKGQGRARAG